MTTNTIRLKLEKELNSIPQLSPANGIIIFGAGNTSALYQKCFEKEGIKPLFYVDNNVSKHGTLFYGVQIISFDDLVKMKNELQHDFPLVLICSAITEVVDEIKKQLAAAAIDYFLMDQYIFSKHKQDILNVFDSLEEESKKLYAEVVITRINNLNISYDMVEENQYFTLPEFKKKKNNEIFVDLGAYVGDSIEQYLEIKSGTFKNIYAFEPNERNFNAMKYRVERLNKEWALNEGKIILINAGVGRNTTNLYMANDNNETPSLAACISENIEGDEIVIYSLDDYFADSNVSFIKADIESYEYDMLLGAQNVIKKNKPLLAICIYHNASDIFSIPLLIKSIMPEYKISIAHHSVEQAETVLYAY